MRKNTPPALFSSPIGDDSETTVAALRAMVETFVHERDWEKFHSPKNITMALAIEAAELMEHFQWLSIEESRSAKNDADRKLAIGEELADVLCYGMALANSMGIDISQTMAAKMEKNRKKYPVEQFKGKFE